MTTVADATANPIMQTAVPLKDIAELIKPVKPFIKARTIMQRQIINTVFEIILKCSMFCHSILFFPLMGISDFQCSHQYKNILARRYFKVYICKLFQQFHQSLFISSTRCLCPFSEYIITS